MMSQPTKSEILESLKKEGITSLEQLAQEAENAAKGAKLNKPAVRKVAGVFVTVISG
jgi:hypothetical protein